MARHLAGRERAEAPHELVVQLAGAFFAVTGEALGDVHRLALPGCAAPGRQPGSVRANADIPRRDVSGQYRLPEARILPDALSMRA
jgi:hypothetical protein